MVVVARGIHGGGWVGVARPRCAFIVRTANLPPFASGKPTRTKEPGRLLVQQVKIQASPFAALLV